MRMKIKTRVCLVCGKEYRPNGNRQRYCSICGQQHAREVHNASHKRYRQMRRAAPQSRACIRCGVDYIPTNAPQKYCQACGIIHARECSVRYNAARQKKIKESPELQRKRLEAQRARNEALRYDPSVRLQRKISSAKEYARRRLDPGHAAQVNNSATLYRARRSYALDAVPFFQAMAAVAAINDK